MKAQKPSLTCPLLFFSLGFNLWNQLRITAFSGIPLVNVFYERRRCSLCFLFFIAAVFHLLCSFNAWSYRTISGLMFLRVCCKADHSRFVQNFKSLTDLFLKVGGIPLWISPDLTCHHELRHIWTWWVDLEYPCLCIGVFSEQLPLTAVPGAPTYWHQAGIEPYSSPDTSRFCEFCCQMERVKFSHKQSSNVSFQICQGVKGLGLDLGCDIHELQSATEERF